MRAFLIIIWGVFVAAGNGDGFVTSEKHNIADFSYSLALPAALFFPERFSVIQPAERWQQGKDFPMMRNPLWVHSSHSPHSMNVPFFTTGEEGKF